MAQSYGAQPPTRVPKARSYGTCPHLHDRAGTFASNIYGYSWLAISSDSYCDSVLFMHQIHQNIYNIIKLITNRHINHGFNRMITILY